MEVGESQVDLGSVEFALCFLELLHLLQMLEELTSPEKLHHKEYLILRLESILQVDQEWVLGLFQNLPLSPRFAQMLLINQILFLHGLNSVILLVALQLAQHHLPKCPLPQHF